MLCAEMSVIHLNIFGGNGFLFHNKKTTIINRVSHNYGLMYMHIGNTQISLWISLVAEENTAVF